ncbi:MAG: YgiQ family radical SAM protein [Planctomycetaceae bacterium]|nr:YgiQ family radical SAM protein [Planctomycetaceae bacterium]
MFRSQLLPISRAEMLDRGWDELDVVFVTGDAYVDHSGFAAAVLSRLLESAGFRVGIISQPDWHSAEAWKVFGCPKLAFCISAGNMDSMVNHYTANRKIRNTDAYSPDGKIGLRPDRATLAYSQRAREAFPDCAVIVGGVEASLRRFAHYDYWSDKIKRSIVLDSKADLLIYGMGEMPLLKVVNRLRDGESIQTIRNVRGTAYRLKQTEDLPAESETVIHLPSMEEIEEDKLLFARMTRLIYDNLNPYRDITLVQEHAKEAVVVNPPSLPLSQPEIDNIYALPFTRKPHPIYTEHNQKIPAWEVIKNSIQIHRGCFGGCSFCSIAAHQGKFVQSRSKKSIINEIKLLSEQPEFNGIISDVGGPTANMYELYCQNEEAKKICNRVSCLFPEQCNNLKVDHSELLGLMREVRAIPNVRQVFVASGVRTDLAQLDTRYISELVEFHVGGHLKTAPEHTHPKVLALMQKPVFDNYLNFCNEFNQHSTNAGKEQYLVPYLMAGFPGTTLQIAIDAAVTLKQQNIRSEQIQEFVPCPGELATCIYYTGVNPLNGEQVYVPKRLRERRLQKALLMYHKTENYHDIKTALHEARREDLIGNGQNCLIAPFPPKAESIRRTSQIKRLQKQNERDKKEKEQRREMFAIAAVEAKREKFAQRNPDEKRSLSAFRKPRSDSDNFRSRRDEPRQFDRNREFPKERTFDRKSDNRGSKSYSNLRNEKRYDKNSDRNNNENNNAGTNSTGTNSDKETRKEGSRGGRKFDSRRVGGRSGGFGNSNRKFQRGGKREESSLKDRKPKKIRRNKPREE